MTADPDHLAAFRAAYDAELQRLLGHEDVDLDRACTTAGLTARDKVRDPWVAGIHRASGTGNAFGGYRCICGEATPALCSPTSQPAVDDA